MPIKGVTDLRRLPRLGKIHLGVKTTNAKGVERPTPVDYFVVPPEVQEVYGEQPRALDVVFPVDDEAVFATQFYRAFVETRGLVCKGDGVTADRLIDSRTKHIDRLTGEMTGEIPKADAKDVERAENVPCLGRDCPYYQRRACREIMNLQFMLPKIPGLGVWQLDTSSFNSIVNINSALAMVRVFFNRVIGVPLLLTLEPMEVSPGGRKKYVHVLNLRSSVTLQQLAASTSKPEAFELPQLSTETPDLLFPTPEQKVAQAEADAEAPTPEAQPADGMIVAPKSYGEVMEWARQTLGKEQREVLAALNISTLREYHLTPLEMAQDLWERFRGPQKEN